MDILGSKSHWVYAVANSKDKSPIINSNDNHRMSSHNPPGVGNSRGHENRATVPTSPRDQFKPELHSEPTSKLEGALEGRKQYGYEPKELGTSNTTPIPLRTNDRPTTLSRSDSVPVASRGDGRKQADPHKGTKTSPKNNQATRRPAPVSAGSNSVRRPSVGTKERNKESSGNTTERNSSHNTGEATPRKSYSNVIIPEMPKVKAPNHGTQPRHTYNTSLEAGNSRPPRRGVVRQPYTARPLDKNTLDEQSTIVATAIPTTPKASLSSSELAASRRNDEYATRPSAQYTRNSFSKPAQSGNGESSDQSGMSRVPPHLRGQITSPSNAPQSAHRIDLDLPDLPRTNAIGLLAEATARRTGIEVSEDGEVRLRVDNLPTTWTLKEFYDAFKSYGNITNLEYSEDNLGRRNGKGRVILKPVNKSKGTFWYSPVITVVQDKVFRLSVRIEQQYESKTIPSPLNKDVSYPRVTKVTAHALDFGVLCSPNTMMQKFTTKRGRVEVEINLKKRYFDIFFNHILELTDPVAKSHRHLIEQHVGYEHLESLENMPSRFAQMRFRIKFQRMKKIIQRQEENGDISMVISLNSPPEFYRKEEEALPGLLSDPKERFWSEFDLWMRQTTVAFYPPLIDESATTLRQPYAEINLGRWTTYKLTFHQTAAPELAEISKMLSDYNIPTEPVSDFKILPSKEASVWNIIDPVPATGASSQFDLLSQLSSNYLSFPVRYQLEAAISQGKLNEYNLDKEFIDRLQNMDQEEALCMLEAVTESKEQFWDPMKIFEIYLPKSSVYSTHGGLKGHCMLIRRATITPTTIIFHTPSVETSNRILRRYTEQQDQFLRIQFRDENDTPVRAEEKTSHDKVFTRVANTLLNGITIGDRHYDFLAFGTSQFRENGAYMFASDSHTSVQSIRDWMGDLSSIKTVGKYCARLGQCFSSTKAITLKPTIIRLDEVERNGRKFSDGVGTISEMMAKFSAEAVHFSGQGYPSAFQFRFNGCKGVLAVDPNLQGLTIGIRPSQEKFGSNDGKLEVIRCSQFASASLNRQLILVLTGLGVPEEVFEDILAKQLDDLKESMTNPQIALLNLSKHVDANQITLRMTGMIVEGFMTSKEPFVDSLLRLWQAWSVKSLKEKSRISVEHGAFLLGVMDETATLKGHLRALDSMSNEELYEHPEMLPEVFCQVSDPNNPGRFIVRQGICFIARNPSLHPGDIRVVRAVDVPTLHHLRDVLVLPQTGDYDLAGMCSGGDLDGDEFMVCWDKRLIPGIRNHAYGEYPAPEETVVNGRITVEHMVSHFVTFMKNNRLGTVANTHTVWADKMEDGISNDKCLELAAIHSIAVDCPKTGVPAIMPRYLRAREYPHFFEKKNGEKEYHSNKILGRLFDQVERIDFSPVYDTNFDPRILSYKVSEKVIAKAAEFKIEYDTHILRIMAQYDIRSEFEIYTSFVLGFTGSKSAYSFQEDLARINNTLHEAMKGLIAKTLGGPNTLTQPVIGSFVAAMYHTTYRQTVAACAEREAGKRHSLDMPLMSFPWIFHKILGALATRSGMFADGEVEYDPKLFNADGKSEFVLDAVQDAVEAEGVHSSEDEQVFAEAVEDIGNSSGSESDGRLSNTADEKESPIPQPADAKKDLSWAEEVEEGEDFVSLSSR